MASARLLSGEDSNRDDEMTMTKASSHERGGTVSEEARTGKRFPLELPIKIHKESAASEAEGTTGNLSAAGVCKIALMRRWKWHFW